MNDAINSFKLNKGQTKLLSLIFCCKIMYSKCLKQKVWYVIVYSIGCPNPEYFGERCNLPCPTTCENRRCHIETGKCFGCKDGYNGSTCNIRKYCWLTSKIRFMQSIISFIMQFAYQYYSNFYIILFFLKIFSHGKYTELSENEGGEVSHWHIFFSLLRFSSSGEFFQIALLINNPKNFVNCIIYIFFRRTRPYKSV